MDGPEFHESIDTLKEEAWRQLQRDTEKGAVSALIAARGIVRNDTRREVLEFVQDEVTQDIANYAVDLRSFCKWKIF